MECNSRYIEKLDFMPQNVLFKQYWLLQRANWGRKSWLEQEILVGYDNIMKFSWCQKMGLLLKSWKCDIQTVFNFMHLSHVTMVCCTPMTYDSWFVLTLIFCTICFFIHCLIIYQFYSEFFLWYYNKIKCHV